MSKVSCFSCPPLISLRASSLGVGGGRGERGESLQRCLRNFHFCVEFFNAKCLLVDIEFGAYVIALRVRRVDNTKMVAVFLFQLFVKVARISLNKLGFLWN